MNFSDICDLVKSDIQDGRLVYKRNKTGKIFNLKISDEAQQIIDYFSTQESAYLFPILNEYQHKIPTQINDRTQSVLKSRIERHLYLFPILKKSIQNRFKVYKKVQNETTKVRKKLLFETMKAILKSYKMN